MPSRQLANLERIGKLKAEPPALDEAHRKRNVAEYEGEIDMDDALVAALIRAAKEIEKRVRALKPLE